MRYIKRDSLSIQLVDEEEEDEVHNLEIGTEHSYIARNIIPTIIAQQCTGT